MQSRAILPLFGCIALETAEHVAYSLGGRVPSSRAMWVGLGIGLHLALLAVWFWLLTLLPLALALPLRGASYLTIVLAGQLVLRERVDRRCWIGVISIVAGLALLCAETAR